MLSLEQLRLKEIVLTKELELVKCQIEFVVSLKRDEHQKEIESPSSSQSKDSASPEQPATGKDSSNPVRVVGLPKIQNTVQTVTTLVKPSDLNLRPNGGIQIPLKPDIMSATEIQFPLTSKPYYVVYNGHNAGIYESWDTAKLATDKVPGVKHKKFRNLMEARTSANIYTKEKMLPPLTLIANDSMLRAKTFASAVSSPPQKMKNLGKLPMKTTSCSEEEEFVTVQVTDFEHLYSCARIASEALFAEEHYFTTDKKNVSYYNFCKNADPQHVFEAFCCGLVNTIYPSSNLLELRDFPKSFRRAVKTFRTKCIKDTDRDIFLKVQSTIPVWDQGVQVYRPHHIVQMGISSGEKYSPSTKMTDQLERDDLPQLANIAMEKMIKRVIDFKGDDKIFVNLQTDRILMYSSSLKAMTNDSEASIIKFQRRIINGSVFGSHNGLICEEIRKITAKKAMPYSCKRCDDSALKDAPTTSTSSNSASTM